MTDLIAYGGLFLIALGAATVLPLQSETAMVGLLLADYSPELLLLVASVGNFSARRSTGDWDVRSTGSATAGGFR